MEQTKNNSIFEIIKFTIISVIIIVFVRTFIAQPFIVSGASMDPTFKTGEYLIVDELTYGMIKNPSRGDVIVFKYPKEPKIYFIKRVIGLPGETVKIRNGSVTIINSENPEGFTLTEKYVNSDHILKDDHEITLGETQYFVMGDNRAESLDSRAWGPLEKKLIVGKPFIRLLPPSVISIFPGAVKN
ncbi:MAG: signal peptidase I [bacterium]|nr:signal peptidase I [bacterium]